MPAEISGGTIQSRALDYCQDLLDIVDFHGAERDHIKFTGYTDPFLPTRYPVTEVFSAVFGALGTVANRIGYLKNGRVQEISVNTDHASMAIMSHILPSVNGVSIPEYVQKLAETYGSNHKTPCENPLTGLFRTKDNRWVHFLASFDPHPTLKILGVDGSKFTDAISARDVIEEKTLQWNSFELEDALAAAGACGCAVRTTEEFLATEQGKEIHKHLPIEVQKICDAPKLHLPPGKRILEGVKVLELCRVIAGPTTTRTLAEYGAQVLKVSSPYLRDVDVLAVDGNSGKRSCFLDLKSEEGKKQLTELVKDCDVFVQGYRHRSMEHLGFTFDDVKRIKGSNGFVYLTVNCYGNAGPWIDRPGWEQLAQAVTGMATVQGGSPNTPCLLPMTLSDYLTGYAGALGVIAALLKRAEEGGSYLVQTSLVQLDLYVISKGLYSAAVGKKLMALYPPFHYYEGTHIHCLHLLQQLQKDRPYLFNGIFEVTPGPLGEVKHMKPVVQMPETPLYFSSPTRNFGVDKAEWV
ncbi:CoA-transferase family III domain-containing protein [Jimgerdemannia flammicorona]|uniref:CoA-transferase family III domain-containing protein n=1 Tax=Jimgerdemannia flammicorona TaxID=994334 RepID=A0A433QZC2_9FUNG|nr:CoA-transferase family III domain-containing protein [Jimgerdemannia flammicorona]